MDGLNAEALESENGQGACRQLDVNIFAYVFTTSVFSQELGCGILYTTSDFSGFSFSSFSIRHLMQIYGTASDWRQLML